MTAAPRGFPLWWGGSLEYWVHGTDQGEVVRSEVPYRTRSKPKGAKPSPDGLWTKWSDGAVLLPQDIRLLVEIKCALCRVEIGTPLYDVDRYELPALAGTDLEQTLYWHPGERTSTADWVSYTDPPMAGPPFEDEGGVGAWVSCWYTGRVFMTNWMTSCSRR